MKVTQFHGGRYNRINNEGNSEEQWIVSGEIEVEGLGMVSIKDCISTETIEKICGEIIFALEQKMKVRHE